MKLTGTPLMLRRADSGITLIEMLIVLAIIGISTGAATLGLGALSQNDAAEGEARRLASALLDGMDQALITGLSQPVDWDAVGYRIGTGPQHALAVGVTLQGGATGLVLADSMSGDAAVFLLQDGDRVWRVSAAWLAVTVEPGGLQ